MADELRPVAAATAAVFVEGRLAGSAVLVDGRHLLTAAHVLRRQAVLVDEVELVFPAVVSPKEATGARVNASRLPLVGDTPSVDVAVLDLGQTLPTWLPRPAALWAKARLPEHVLVFGFPTAERELSGVWRPFDVSGPVTRGRVQLNWTSATGTWEGQSGGAVVDAATAALVGVLVEGAEKGYFDRFIPLSSVRPLWPDLPIPWLIDSNEARDHFTRRSLGQRSRARGGDLFRGRLAALAAVRDWLTTEQAPGQVLVVTGQPGAGKSAVIARVALAVEAERVGPGLAFHARGATYDEFVSAVANLMGLSRVDSRDALIDGASNTTDEDRWIVVVDALDEAATASDQQQIATTLREMAELPRLRVAAATRPLAANSRLRYAPGGILPQLGVRSVHDTNLVDLDTDAYFDLAGLQKYVAALLVQEDASSPGPPGCAWTAYRSDTRLRDRLAPVIALRANRNHLVAALAADQLSQRKATLDPDSPEFVVADIPSEVGEALDKYLNALEDPQRVMTEGLLSALAYARGEGIDDRLWLTFAAALGFEGLGGRDLAQLRRSPAADYLLQTTSTTSGAVSRLFHQALADELLKRRSDQPTDEHEILQRLLPESGCGGWVNVSAYTRTYAADHAAAAFPDDLLSLIDDVHYLLVADFSRLLSFLTPAGRFGGVGAVLRRAGSRAGVLHDAEGRARVLALTAAHLGLATLRGRFAEMCGAYVPVWAHSVGGTQVELVGHDGSVNAVAIGRLGDRDAIVSGGMDGSVRVWDAADGQSWGEPLRGHDGTVNAVAIGHLGDRDVIVSGGMDGSVRVWDATTQKGIDVLNFLGSVRAVAVSAQPTLPIIAVASGISVCAFLRQAHLAT